MIVTKIYAGLGNQLFQYAAGFAAAKRHNTYLMQDPGHYMYVAKAKAYPRNYKLDHYSVSYASIFRLSADTMFGGLVKLGITTNKLRDWCIERSGLIYLRESQDVAPSIIKDGSYLNGYWQSEDYFSDYTKELRAEFKLSKPLNDDNSKWLDAIKKTDCAISIHFRRGDYQKVDHLDGDYYLKALACLKNQLDSKKLSLFVFSDQPELAKNFLGNMIKDKHMAYFVDVNTEQDGHFDLELMRNCKHHIIANSSFSWWSAWLCENHNKIVVAPKSSEGRPLKTARPCKHWVTL